MTRSLPLVSAALTILALSATPAGADPISIVVQSGVIQVQYRRGDIASEMDLRATGGFRLDAVSSSGHSPAVCLPCMPGESISMSAYVSTPYVGTLRFGDRQYSFDVDNGAGELDLASPDFTLPVSAFGAVSFRSPFRLEGYLAPTFDYGDGAFVLRGAGMVTGRFAVHPFDAEFGGQQYQLESLRFDFDNSAPVPEPATFALLATGLIAIFCAAKWRHSSVRATHCRQPLEVTRRSVQDC